MVVVLMIVQFLLQYHVHFIPINGNRGLSMFPIYKHVQDPVVVFNKALVNAALAGLS